MAVGDMRGQVNFEKKAVSPFPPLNVLNLTHPTMAASSEQENLHGGKIYDEHRILVSMETIGKWNNVMAACLDEW